MPNIRWFFSQPIRNACAVHKHYRRLLAAQSDLLTAAAQAAVQLKLNELRLAIAEGHTGRINIKAEELQFAADKNLKAYPNPGWRENVEVLLVALSVAMAIRTFFLQPFKIPTVIDDFINARLKKKNREKSGAENLRQINCSRE